MPAYTKLFLMRCIHDLAKAGKRAADNQWNIATYELEHVLDKYEDIIKEARKPNNRKLS